MNPHKGGSPKRIDVSSFSPVPIAQRQEANPSVPKQPKNPRRQIYSPQQRQNHHGTDAGNIPFPASCPESSTTNRPPEHQSMSFDTPRWVACPTKTRTPRVSSMGMCKQESGVPHTRTQRKPPADNSASPPDRRDVKHSTTDRPRVSRGHSEVIGPHTTGTLTRELFFGDP